MQRDALATGDSRFPLSATDTSATVLPVLCEAGNQFSVRALDANAASERGQGFLVGDAFLTVSAKEG